jgi:hypothetical protein
LIKNHCQQRYPGFQFPSGELKHRKMDISFGMLLHVDEQTGEIVQRQIQIAIEGRII